MASKAAVHTHTDIIAHCQSQEFLQQCIVKSGFDEELCTDITEACDVAALNALDLASGDLSCEEAAQRLFLVNTEAKKLLKVCSRMCAREGVNFGDGIADAESSEEEQETVLTASPPPRASSPTPEEEPSDMGRAAEETDGPSQPCAGTEEGSEAGGALKAGSSLTKEQQEEQERKQQQLKEEQLAAARAAFAPKAIPSSAATSAAMAVQPMQAEFPPGFSPPPPYGSNSNKSNKPSPAIPHSRKLSAYDGNSFGVRENTFSPSPATQSSRTAGRHAPSPRTPPVSTVVDFNSFSASLHQAATPRMTSSAASRYQYDRLPSTTRTTPKPTLSADAMKPANMSTPTPEALKPADMTLQTPPSPPSTSTKDAHKPTPGSKTKLDPPAASPMPRMPSYMRPTSAYQAQAAKRPTGPDINMTGRIPTGSVALGGRTPPTPPIRPSSASTQLPANYVHKAMHDKYSPYLSGLSAKAKRNAAPRPQVQRPSPGDPGHRSPLPPPSPSPDVTPSPPKSPEFEPIRPSLLKPTKAFLAATNGNSQRRARPSTQTSTSSTSSSTRISHTQSAILSPADVAQASKAASKARPPTKSVRPPSRTPPAPSPTTTSHTEDTLSPFRAMASTPATPRLSASGAERRHPPHHHTDVAGLQHKHGSHSDPEEDDLDTWLSVRTPSGKQYITPSMLQPHPHIPMQQLASESGVRELGSESVAYEKPPWQSGNSPSPRGASRVPRGPADEQLRMSLHKGSRIPDLSGQVNAAQVQRSIQLKQQHEQQQQLMRALSAANYHSAMEKAEAMRRSLRKSKSGSSLRTSQHHDAVGHRDEQRSKDGVRNDMDDCDGGEEECRVGTPPTPDQGFTFPASASRTLETIPSGETRGEVDEGR